MADFGGGLGFEALDEYVLPPLDLLQLAACARREGWTCHVVDSLASGRDHEGTVADVAATSPDVVVVSSTVPTLVNDLALTADLRAVARRVLLRSRSADP